MALIIRLNNEVLSAQDEPANDELGAQEPAEVILFPGVRYERWTDAPLNNDAQLAYEASSAFQGEDETEPSSIKRDWLEI